MSVSRKNTSILHYLDRIYAHIEPKLTFQARTVEDWKQWRAKLRKELRKLLGGFPRISGALKVKKDLSEERKTHFLEKVYLYTEPDVAVPLYILKPKNTPEPYKAIIALHGHGSGARLIVGMEQYDEERKSVREHGSNYGARLAEMGYMVFAPDMRGLGELRDEPELSSGKPWDWSCLKQSLNAFLLGETLIGMRVWDVKRIVEYIRMRPEKIANRKIACIGHSGGGTATMYAGAVLDEISPVILSGCFNTFKASIIDIAHCPCNYVPGIVQYVEQADVTALIAPKPLFIETGRNDDIFPLAGFCKALKTVKAVYKLLGAEGNLAYDITDEKHKFNGRKSLPWIANHLA